MPLRFSILIFIFLLFIAKKSDAELPKRDSLFKNFPTVKVLPIVFYSPETKFGGGIVSTINFKVSKKDSLLQSSLITVLASYTVLKQRLLLIPFKILLPKRRYYTEGEVDFTNFTYSYWGNGNTSDSIEKFQTKYSRVTFFFLRKMKYNFYGGIKYTYENFNITKVDSSAKSELLNNKNIVGRTGGRNSGIGFQLTYDTRDNLYSTYKGALISLTGIYFTKPLGTDFEYNRYSLDATKYFTIFPKQILVLNAFFDYTVGNVPFTQLAMIGGQKKLRGYYEGRYRDKDLVSFAAEYRFKIYKRFGAVGFANLGKVAAEPKYFLNFDYYRYTVGGGLRYILNLKDRVSIRLDAAFGKHTSGYYLTVGEAL